MCRDFDWFEWFFRQRAITERTVIQTEGGRGEDSFQTESGHGENSFSDRAITERTVIQTDETQVALLFPKSVSQIWHC